MQKIMQDKINLLFPYKYFVKMRFSETYSKVQINKHLSDTYSIHNGLKCKDILSQLLYNTALGCASMNEMDISVAGQCQ